MTGFFSFVQRKSTLILALIVVVLCMAAFAWIQGDALRGKTDLFTMQTAYDVVEMQ
jgi:hypothetical protein